MIDFKIINFKSEPKQTALAPEWNYFMCETFFKNINCKNLSKFLLSKQKEILKLNPTCRRDTSDYTDGYTGLGSILQQQDLKNIMFLILRIKKYKN
jgi:hypothetical protein